jgi:hypothetical protein
LPFDPDAVTENDALLPTHTACEAEGCTEIEGAVVIESDAVLLVTVEPQVLQLTTQR